MYGDEQRLSEYFGRKIVGYEVSPDQTCFNLNLEGITLHFRTDGDCCSTSWIEHVEAPGDLGGSTLTGVDEVAMGEITPTGKDDREQECLQAYKTTFKTDRGDIELEYRNGSNGYYGGSLDFVGTTP